MRLHTNNEAVPAPEHQAGTAFFIEPFRPEESADGFGVRPGALRNLLSKSGRHV